MPVFWAEGTASRVCHGLEGEGEQCPWKSERGGEWQKMSSAVLWGLEGLCQVRKQG